MPPFPPALRFFPSCPSLLLAVCVLKCVLVPQASVSQIKDERANLPIFEVEEPQQRTARPSSCTHFQLL